MKKFLKSVLIFLVVFLATQVCFAEEYKILVLPDSLQFASTNYYVYPDASIIFASDIVNNLKKSGQVQTVSMSQVRDTFRNNVKLQILAKETLKEFKYNYNVGFVDVKKLTHAFDTNKILIVTSTTDVQSYALKRTVWDMLNFPGESVIKPQYKLSTYAVLVDVDKEEVLWQQTYHKNIGASDCRIIPVGFAPAAEQLEKIKFYSEYFLSPIIAKTVENKILPPPVLTPVETNVSTQTEATIVPQVENFKPAPFAPTKPRVKKQNLMINDL